MVIIKIICKSITSPLEVMNQKAGKGKLTASLAVVLAAAFMGSVLVPILYYLTFRDKYELTLGTGKIVLPFCVGILTWLAGCTLFRLFSLILKKGIKFGQIASSWGFSYIPNILCIAAYACLQLNSGIFIPNGIAAFAINTFFIALLIWKAIYYFIEMRNVLNASAAELVVFTIAIGICFAGLMSLGSIAGIQVPML